MLVFSQDQESQTYEGGGGGGWLGRSEPKTPKIFIKNSNIIKCQNHTP